VYQNSAIFQMWELLVRQDIPRFLPKILPNFYWKLENVPSVPALPASMGQSSRIHAYGVKTILDFLTSETAGFLLKLFAGIAAAAFGMLGIGTKTREDDGKLTPSGRIALIGIVVAGLLAIGTSVYDFATGQKKAKEGREKSERLLLSVQRGIYPLKGISGEVRIEFTNDFVGAAEYKAMLRGKLPTTKGPCTDGKDYFCYESDDDGNTYGIRERSALFPKRGSPVEIVLRSIDIDVSLIQPKAGLGNQHFNRIGFFSFQLSKADPKSAVITFKPATGVLQYEVEHFRIPDTIASESSVYSLIEVFPGFIEVSSGFSHPFLCELLKTKTGPDCSSAKTLEGGFRLAELMFRFEYPKAIHFERGDSSLITCASKEPDDSLIITLPDDIDQIDAQGNIWGLTHPETFKAGLCAALNDPRF
jgi:hypothetical protein